MRAPGLALVLLSVLLVSSHGFGALADPPAALGKGVTVVLVRHAETSASTRSGGDPELSDAGRERAEALAKLLSKAGVTHLFSSEYRRTRETLAPLAKKIGQAVAEIPARESDRQVAALAELPAGSVAVVAGHSNTVPTLLAALGGRARELHEHERYGKVLGHEEYDRLFLVLRGPDAEAEMQTLELRYGD